MYRDFYNIIAQLPGVKGKVWEMTSVMWIWVILSCFSEIEYSPTLITSSCNGSYAFLNCYDAVTKAKTKLVAKFQMSSYADPIIVDNINGFVINELTVILPQTKQYFMEYVDSCQTYVCMESNAWGGSHSYKSQSTQRNTKSNTPKTSNSGYNFTNNGYVSTSSDQYNLTNNNRKPKTDQYVFPLRDLLLDIQNSMTEDDVAKHLLDVRGRSKLRPVSICKSVPSPASLSSIIIKGVYTLDALRAKLADLFKAMRDMGRFGFTHNDAHTGNVLLNGESEVFVLIDFGRVVFSNKLIKEYDASLAKKVEAQIAFEEMKALDSDKSADEIKPTDYTHFTLSYNGEAFTTVQMVKICESMGLDFCLKHLYLFDVMCIAMNTLTLLLNTQNAQLDKAGYNNIFSYDAGKKIYKIKPWKYIEDYSNSLKSNKKDPLLLGLFWFAFLMGWIYDNDSHAQGNCIYIDDDDNFVVILAQMVKNDHIHYNFQLVGISDLVKFCRDVEAASSSIDNIVNTTLGQRSSGGGAKSQRVSKRAIVQTCSTSKPCFRKRVTPWGKVKGGSDHDVEYQELYDAYVYDRNIASMCMLRKHKQRKR
jgi:hypothetical protein